MKLWFAVWLVISLGVIIALWMRHQALIKNIGNYTPNDNKNKKRYMGL